MKIIGNIEQGTHEWLECRAGIPTASRFSRILTPKTLGFSKGAEEFAFELLLERKHGMASIEGSAWMERGRDLEAEARSFYELFMGVEVQQVGFCLTDDGRAGCSPDGLVGDDGGIEIKAPAAKTHMSHLFGRTDPAASTQVQGSLWVTGRKWWDQISYCPGLPPVILRTHPDPEWFAKWEDAFEKFYAGMEKAERMLADLTESGGRIEGFVDEVEALVGEMYGAEATA